MYNYFVMEMISGCLSETINYVTHDVTLATKVCGNLSKQFPDKTFVIARQACRDCDDDVLL